MELYFVVWSLLWIRVQKFQLNPGLGEIRSLPTWWNIHRCPENAITEHLYLRGCSAMHQGFDVFQVFPVAIRQVQTWEKQNIARINAINLFRFRFFGVQFTLFMILFLFGYQKNVSPYFVGFHFLLSLGLSFVFNRLLPSAFFDGQEGLILWIEKLLIYEAFQNLEGMQELVFQQKRFGICTISSQIQLMMHHVDIQALQWSSRWKSFESFCPIYELGCFLIMSSLWLACLNSSGFE